MKAVCSFYRSPVAIAVALSLSALVYPALAAASASDNSTSGSDHSTAQTNGSAMSGQQPTAPKESAEYSQAGPHAAQAKMESNQTPSSDAQLRDAMKVSKDGFMAMRLVEAARVSIFDGNPKMAKEQLSKAESSLKTTAKAESKEQSDASTQASNSSANSPNSSNSSNSTSSSGSSGSTGSTGSTPSNTPASTASNNSNFVPIDGQVVVADSFVATPEKKSHVDKANQNLAKGHAKAAMDELKLADVDASFTRVLMPLDATTQHVDNAMKLLGEQKYYEANLELKSAEDGLRLDSVALNEVPKAGNHATAANESGAAMNQKSGAMAQASGSNAQK